VDHLSDYGQLVDFTLRLESEWRAERASARRGKLLIRLALARVALERRDADDAVRTWRRLAADHLGLWDAELDAAAHSGDVTVPGTAQVLARAYISVDPGTGTAVVDPRLTDLIDSRRADTGHDTGPDDRHDRTYLEMP
jgi:hypothetical protein